MTRRRQSGGSRKRRQSGGMEGFALGKRPKMRGLTNRLERGAPPYSKMEENTGRTAIPGVRIAKEMLVSRVEHDTKLPEILHPGKIRRLPANFLRNLPKGSLVEVVFDPSQMVKDRQDRKHILAQSGRVNVNYGAPTRSNVVILEVGSVTPNVIDSNGHTIHGRVLYEFDLAEGHFVRSKIGPAGFFYFAKGAFPKINAVYPIEIAL